MRIHRFVLEESVRPQFVSVERVLLGKAFHCRWSFISRPEVMLGSTSPTSFRILPNQMVLDWQSFRADIELSEKTLATFSDRVILFQVVEVAATGVSSPLGSFHRDGQVIASGTIDPAVFAKRSQKDYAIKLEQNFVCIGKLFLNMLVESIDAKEFAECTELARSMSLVVERISIAPTVGGATAGGATPVAVPPHSDSAGGFTMGGDYVLRVRDGEILLRTPSTICEDPRRLRWNYELRFNLGTADAAAASIPILVPSENPTATSAERPRLVKFTLVCDGAITVAKFVMDLTRVRELAAGNSANVGDWRGCSIPVLLRTGGRAVLDILVKQTEMLRLVQNAARSPVVPPAAQSLPTPPSAANEQNGRVAGLSISAFAFPTDAPAEVEPGKTQPFSPNRTLRPPPIRTADDSPLSISTPKAVITPAPSGAAVSGIKHDTAAAPATLFPLSTAPMDGRRASGDSFQKISFADDHEVVPLHSGLTAMPTHARPTLQGSSASPEPPDPQSKSTTSTGRSGVSEGDLVKMLTDQLAEQQKQLQNLADEVRQLRCSSIASAQSSAQMYFRSDSLSSAPPGLPTNGTTNASGIAYSSRSPSTESAVYRGRAQTPQKTHTLEQFTLPQPFDRAAFNVHNYPSYAGSDQRSFVANSAAGVNGGVITINNRTSPARGTQRASASNKPRPKVVVASSSPKRSGSRSRPMSSSAWR